MRALDPPLFPNFGSASTGEYESDNFVGDNLSNCTVQHETSLAVSVSSEGNGIDNNSVVIKKLIHKANERDRRKKTKYLFSSLSSCLPGSNEPLNIPQTISRTVEYIPELKEEVKKLTQKKEDLLVRVPGQREPYVRPQPKVAASHVSTVFATELKDNEVMVQISSSKNHNLSIYNVLSGLEEDGFVIIAISSSSCQGERLFYTLHLQVDNTDSYKLVCKELSQRILYLYEERGNSSK